MRGWLKSRILVSYHRVTKVNLKMHQEFTSKVDLDTQAKLLSINVLLTQLKPPRFDEVERQCPVITRTQHRQTCCDGHEDATSQRHQGRDMPSLNITSILPLGRHPSLNPQVRSQHRSFVHQEHVSITRFFHLLDTSSNFAGHYQTPHSSFK